MILSHTVLLSKKCNQPVYRHIRLSTTQGKKSTYVIIPQSLSHIFVRYHSVGNRKCRCWPNPPCHHHDSGSCNYKFHERVHNGGSSLTKGKGTGMSLSPISDQTSKTKLNIHKRPPLMSNTGRSTRVLFDPALVQVPLDVRLVATSTNSQGKLN